jgi:predicted lipoprotein with Yx(FWY)xxD motif
VRSAADRLTASADVPVIRYGGGPARLRALAIGLSLLAAGCGARHGPPPSSGEPTRPPHARAHVPPSSSSAPEPSIGPVELKARDTAYGRIVVDGQGMTVYTYAGDNAEYAPTCTGACAFAWPPVLTDAPVIAGPGINTRLIATSYLPDGTKQVVYAGWPLYRSALDTRPGDLNGDGWPWYTITAAKGERVR